MDSSLVKAHVSQREPPGASGQRHDRGGVQGTGHRDQADEVNGLLPITETTVDGYGIGHEATRYVQNSDGRFPPSPVDIDARWRISRRGKRAGLNYRQNVIAWVWLHRLGVASSPGCGFIAWVWLHRGRRGTGRRYGRCSAGGRFTGGLPTHLRGMGSRPGSVGLPAGSSNRCRWRRTQPLHGTGKLRPLPEERGIAACIPPSAEEPIRLRFGDHARWVYPRVGGQTKWSP